MLKCALEFKQIFPRYQQRDPSYKYLPSDEDWAKVKEVCTFLALFNEVTKIISGSEYPTSNLFLTELCNVKELLDMRSQSNVPWMRSMASKMQMKFDKYWGDCNLLISIAAVLDPRNKMTLINFSFKVMYSEEEASWQINIVRDSLYELYREYVEAYKANNIIESLETDMGENLITSVSTESGEDVELVPWRSRFEDYVRKNTIQDAKSELDTYLEEGVFICKEHPSHFDALDWWKANNLKFRILSKMACEILSIPITTVASESTFSAGGRVIDTYRSSLGTDTVQMLLCGSDWYRHFYSLKSLMKK